MLKLRRRVVAVMILLCLVPQIAPADRVVLRDGEEIVGTLANREKWEEDASRWDVISILVKTDSGKQDLQHYLPGEVDYVVLQDGDTERVIDIMGIGFSGGRVSEAEIEASGPPNQGKRDAGVAMMISGALLAFVGGFIRFGDEKATVTPSSLSYDERSHNGLNYALMIGGAIIFTVSAAPYIDARTDSHTSLSLDVNPEGTTYAGIFTGSSVSSPD